jgi:integrase
LPETFTKTGTERVVTLNTLAKKVITSRRGINEKYVFTFKGRPMTRLHNSGWRNAWRKTGLPVDSTVLKGVHNLRHTFGRRLRAAGVPIETRKALLGHSNGDITTHYSAAELSELIEASERVVRTDIAQTPTLTLARNRDVGKVSEKNRGQSSY